MRLLLVDLDSSYNLPVKKLSAFLYHNRNHVTDKYVGAWCSQCNFITMYEMMIRGGNAYEYNKRASQLS